LRCPGWTLTPEYKYLGFLSGLIACRLHLQPEGGAWDGVNIIFGTLIDLRSRQAEFLKQRAYSGPFRATNFACVNFANKMRASPRL